MIGTTMEDAMARNRVETDGVASATDFIGRRQTDSDTPQCFLVKAAAGHVIPGHFHAVDQFQIFVEGSAALGRFPVRLGSIHYTDAFTPYGPIIASDEGYAYFTFRPESTTSYHKMPAEARLLKESRKSGASKRRMLMADIDEAPAGKAGLAELFVEPDGVAAYSVTGGAGERLALPVAVDHGAFLLVIDGEITAGGKAYPLKSCIWVDGGEPMPEAVAGKAGAVVIVAAFGAGAA